MSLIKLLVKGISYSHTQNGAYALILDEVQGKRKLPIVIGAFEAQSIAIAIDQEMETPRPLTHDLFKTFADSFSIVVKQVIIHKLVDGVFFSSLICERDAQEHILDARTSDAIALAVRFNAPVFTYKDIMDTAGIVLDVEDLQQQELEELEQEQDNDDIVAQLEQILDNANQEQSFASFTLEQIQTLLEQAIAEEDYEKAAKLRDAISKRI